MSKESFKDAMLLNIVGNGFDFIFLFYNTMQLYFIVSIKKHHKY